MKFLSLAVFCICSTHTFCQSTSNSPKSPNTSLLKNKTLNEGLTGKIDQFPTNKLDTNLIILYQKKEINNPAIFVNGKFLPGQYSILSTLNSNDIDSLTATKDSIVIDNIVYYGQIRLKTKHPFNPVLISLQTLKEKYTNLKNKSSIFMIDGVIINAESDKYFVAEASLLRIIIENVQNTKENIDLGLIKILTKTETNISDLQKIRIRGKE